MPFMLPGINHLPPLALAAVEEHRKTTSGFESYRSSVSSTSTTDVFDLARQQSTSSSISGSFDFKTKQDLETLSSAPGSSPHSGIRSQSISLPPISELMVPASGSAATLSSAATSTSTSVVVTPIDRTRANSVVSPRASHVLTRPRSQGYLNNSFKSDSDADVRPTYAHSPSQPMPYIQHQQQQLPNYGYAAVQEASSPTAMVQSHPRSDSMVEIYYQQQYHQQHQYHHQPHPQPQPQPQPQPLYREPQPPLPQQQQHYLHSAAPAYPHVVYHQHIQLQQQPRSHSEASVVYVPPGAHPHYYQQQPQQLLIQQQQHQLSVAMSSGLGPQTRGSHEEPPKKEVKRRTRTGCLTCRRRRIKCDERKPHCHNCEKSKIYCAGYQAVRPTKTELKKMNKVMRVGSIIG